MRFVHVRIMHIVYDVMFSNILAESSKAIYVRYIRVSQMMIKRKVVLAVLINLSQEETVARILGITQLDDLNICFSSEEGILLIIHDVDMVSKTDHKPASSHANLLYKHTIALLYKLHSRLPEQGKEQFPPFELFLKVGFSKNSISQSILSLFISAMRLWDCEAKVRSEKWEVKAEARMKSFVDSRA